ncbi:MAG TPA: SMI1/KNR4 family protein [Chloroflexia bacterium]|nr:SMI1/KNR4 family protein [Chloroflexia bacterium]
MPHYTWNEFLLTWSKKIIGSQEFATFLTQARNEDSDRYTPDVLASGWLGYPGATEEEIVAAENRLGIALPPDYREFLQVSNGWRWVNSFIPRLWSVQDIHWLRVIDPETINGWNAGWDIGRKLYSGSGEDDEIHEQKYLSSTLRVSDVEYAGTAMLLLNPEIVNSSGEWEAWFFAHWVPGADIYASFWDLMQAFENTIN